MSALAEVARLADPGLQPHAVAEPEGALYDHLPRDRAYVLEAVREAYELHYGEPRAFTGMEPDLRLLAGDALYAQGLARLAELGDLPAIAELADLISSCAQAHAAGEPGRVPGLWARTERFLSA
jgi:hypothetical protein